MPTDKASWRSFEGGLWVKGPTENTPGGSLRRSANTAKHLGQGSILSRSGNASIFPTIGSAVHSLFYFIGRAVRYVGAGTGLFSGTTGVPVSSPATWLSDGGAAPAFNGKRLEFMELPSQFLATNPNVAADLSRVSPNTDFLFISGGGPAIKVDATDRGSYWGIDAPSNSFMTGVTVTPIPYTVDTSKPILDCESLTNTQGAGPSGFAVALDPNRKVVGANSIRLDCPRDGETMFTTSFAPSVYSPLNLTTFTNAGQKSTDEDYIQFWVHCARPQNVKSIDIKFFAQPAGVFTQTLYNQDPNNPSTTTAPYTNYYHLELTVQAVREKRKRQLLALGDFVPFDPENKALARYLRNHAPDKGPDLDALQFINPTTIAVSRNTWTLVTVPKGLFDRSGVVGTAGFTWANIVGVQISVETNKSGNTSVWVDDFNLKGGVGTRGDYLYTFTFRNDNTGQRSNPPYAKDANGIITLVTTPSVTLDRQGSTIGGFPVALTSFSFRGGTFDPAGSGLFGVLDNQVTHIEVWRTVGNGNPGKPNAPFVAPTSIQMFLVDKVPVGNTSYVDTTADYPGMHSLQGAAFLNSDQPMEFDNLPPWSVNTSISSPRNSTMGQAVYHPPSGRVHWLDSNQPTRVFYSPPGRPESIEGFIEPTTANDPLKRLVIWNDTLYILSGRRIYQLTQAGEPGNPAISNPIAGVIGVRYPYTVCAIDGGVFYVAQDGARVFNGQTSTLVAEDALAPLFRGNLTVTENMNAIASNPIGSIDGPFAAYCRDEVLLTDMKFGVYGFHVPTNSWRYISTPNVTTFYPEVFTFGSATPTTVAAGYSLTGGTTGAVSGYDGSTLAGEDSGIVGETTVDVVQPGSLFEVKTPGVFVSGENIGIVRMVYIEADTQGFTLNVSILLDANTVVLATINSGGFGKQRFEVNINRTANIGAIYISADYTTLTKRIEISSIEIEVYESAGE
jgi:hypothetical protein